MSRTRRENSLGASKLVWMMQIKPGEQSIFKQEYDYGILARLLKARPMMVPITPRLCIFTVPKSVGRGFCGVLTTPMLQLPRRLDIHGDSLVMAFYKGQPQSLTQDDVNKFFMLFKTPGQKVAIARTPELVGHAPS